MSVQFTAPNGQPVIIRHPDQVVALRGYAKTCPESGEVREGTIVMFENGELVWLKGRPEVIEAALAAECKIKREEPSI
jgi:hypothetical protein